MFLHVINSIICPSLVGAHFHWKVGGAHVVGRVWTFDKVGPFIYSKKWRVKAKVTFWQLIRQRLPTDFPKDLKNSCLTIVNYQGVGLVLRILRSNLPSWDLKILICEDLHTATSYSQLYTLTCIGINVKSLVVQNPQCGILKSIPTRNSQIYIFFISEKVGSGLNPWA